ncbi:CubicO group peptidase, beta-lactamase class C family [Actinoplanes derwentensis]|uniref:CubicO group peptidase, beta-lactamase class C family n=2 Tax=Actinoplanes derwentensis TaxID=113562 RepID=A0A1H1S9Z2_9ACTN|nr:serine hydrolase [Actinoplanes derwentensis]SDS44784.1 CubicO group peptidase, beta-lactamase class C family [Actinoplanes derwentensis]
MEKHVADGLVPGMVAVLARHGQVHVETVGALAFDGAGIAADTIFRLGSTSKPIVAACVMTLVEDFTLRLDDPVDELLPELAGMRVLRDPDGPLGDTVPAVRAITVRDLLTYTMGTGMVPAEPGTIPIADALDTIDGSSADGWLRGLGELPLVHQPGERWMYDTAATVTGVLVARATGMSFGEALRERLLGPLGMTDTGFSVDPNKINRLAVAYAHRTPTVDDGPTGPVDRPPVFERGGGGIVSTPNDFLTFTSMLLNGGVHRGERVLSRPSVTLMTTDQLTPRQREISGFWPGYFADIGWGFGLSVRTRRTQLGPSVGSYGWPGYYGTGWWNDPSEDLTAFVFMQRAHLGDQGLPMWADLWNSVYQALDD